MSDSDSMRCCPLQEPDGYLRSEVCETTTPRARKQHRCGECRRVIEIGERYENCFQVYDGRPDINKTCLVCAEIRDHFACGKGWIWGELWSDLEQAFFPDMKAGGACMEGLSPAAKQTLIDKRLAWLFESEQERDGALPPGVTHLEIYERAERTGQASS